MPESHDHAGLLRTLQRFETHADAAKLTSPPSLGAGLKGYHAAGKHLDKCNLESEEARLAVGRIETDLLSQSIEAVSAGKAERIDVSSIFEAEDRKSRLEVEQRLLSRTFESAIAQAHSELLNSAEEIILERLRPRLDALLDDAAKLIGPLRNITTPADALNAGEKASTAWRKVSEPAATWGNLSRVYSLLYDLAFDGMTQDVTGFVSGFKTPNDAAVDAARFSKPLQPEDPAARLVYAITENLTPWFPLPSERDEAIKPLRARFGWMYPPLRPPHARGASWEKVATPLDAG